MVLVRIEGRCAMSVHAKHFARLLVGTLTMLIVASASWGEVAWRTEDYERAPWDDGGPDNIPAVLLTSPFGVVYDFYEDRVKDRHVFEETYGMLSGPMDEAFYWGNNNILTGPSGWSCHRAAGEFYSDAHSNEDRITTNEGFLYNGYGTGYPANTGPDGAATDYILGMTFTNQSGDALRLTQIDSMSFGYAGGSNRPTGGVTVRGMLADDDGVFTEKWHQDFTVEYLLDDDGVPILNERVILPEYRAISVNRIEIDRNDWPAPICHPTLPTEYSWYTLDNLTFSYETTNWPAPAPAGLMAPLSGNADGGEYTWQFYPGYSGDGMGGDIGSIVPTPGSLLLGLLGLAMGGKVLRRARGDHQDAVKIGGRKQ